MANLIYVGRLDDNKNILRLLTAFEDVKHLVGQFTIVGDGPKRAEIKRLASQYNNVVVTGALPSRLIPRIMALQDLLILPSKYDGWGAVVNEALGVGTPVVCSDACGAGCLLDTRVRGEVFNQSQMTTILARWLAKGPVTPAGRDGIRRWASERISGEAAARYFTAILREEDMLPPWQ